MDNRLTFKVGKADPVLVGPGQTLLTLDPAASKSVFSIYAINYAKLNLKIYAVQSSDWPEFKQALRDWRQTDKTPKLPGRLVEDKSLTLDIPDDTLTQVDLELGKYMNGSYGQFVIFLEPPAGLFEAESDKWQRYSQTFITWAQVTRIGLDAYNDHSGMVAWATDYIDRVVSDMLDLASDETGRLELRLERVDLWRLVRAAVGRAVPTTDRGRVRIEIRDILFAWADELRIERVLSNLVCNALKYGDGSITVRLDARGIYACVSVIDAGPGLTADESRAIFERHRRGTSNVPGHGLGLYTSRRMIEAHRGGMGIESQPGRGSPEAAEIMAEMGRFIAAHDSEYIYRGGQEMGQAWGVVRSPDETLDDPDEIASLRSQ